MDRGHAFSSFTMVFLLSAITSLIGLAAVLRLPSTTGLLKSRAGFKIIEWKVSKLFLGAMKPLEGITILEFSTMITASFAAMMMEEQGATVIKVEPMNVGDPMRYIGANKGGISSLFANCTVSKRSIRANLCKEAEGQQLIRELIPKVDIFIHTSCPGVMDKLNLGSDALQGF